MTFYGWANEMSTGVPTESSLSESTGIPAPEPTDAGTEQTGSYSSPATAPPTIKVLCAVPAQTNVSISGPGVVQIGGPSQYGVQVSLTAGTIQLAGHVNDATNENTDPPTGSFVWISRNTYVASVSNSGLVTLFNRGQVTIECRYSRQANVSYSGAAPSGVEFAYATVDAVVGE